MRSAQVAHTFIEMAFMARATSFYTAHSSNFAAAALAWGNLRSVTVPTDANSPQCGDDDGRRGHEGAPVSAPGRNGKRPTSRQRPG